MAIKTQCSCGFSFNAKDALAGKKVKCPRCQGVVLVPAPSAAMAASAASGPRVNKRLLDLLDDAGVKSTPRGPVCAACGEEMDPTAVICIQCGYNVATGQYLETYTDDDEDVAEAHLSDAQRRMAKAEEEIANSPIGAETQDFGDGADSYVVAMAGIAIFGVLLLVGLGVVLLMDSLTQAVEPAVISAFAATGLYLICGAWLTFIAFQAGTGQGIACVCTLGLFCPIFGFMQGRGTIAPAIIMVATIVIGGGSWAYAIANGFIGG